jgi:hypothetical protein
MLNVDEAAPVKWGNYDLTGQAKRRPGEIDSVFHWAGKIHKN